MVGWLHRGDSSFTEEVDRAVTRAVADALAGELGPARILEPGTHARERCAESGLRYVAGGKIHHLYGKRRQNSYVFFPVFIIMWNFDAGDPVGIASLDLELTDCETGETLISERFREQKRLEPARTISEAARSALRGLTRDVRRATTALPGR